MLLYYGLNMKPYHTGLCVSLDSWAPKSLEYAMSGVEK